MDPNRNMLWGRVLAEELTRAGVRFVCIAPGSRSGPLAIALAEERGLRVSVHLDERSAGFYALGLARTSGGPAAVLCTSGTAAANLLPAVVEAFHARVPLVVMTADRPAELRGCGAPQTIDQARLYGSHALEFAELPLPEPQPAVLRALRSTVCRLVDRCLGPPAGPVHVNVPLRDPLDPRPVPGDVPVDLAERDPLAFRGRPGHPYVEHHRAEPACGAAAARLAEQIQASPCGLIVAGPMPTAPGLAEAVLELGRASGYPILADCLSPLRTGARACGAVLGRHDAFLRSASFAEAHRPELVLRLGSTPTSKSLGQFLAGCPQLLVDPVPGSVADPGHSGGGVLRAGPARLCREAARLLQYPPADPKFVAGFIRAERQAGVALAAAAPGEWYERDLVEAMAAALPEDSLLFAGNSMPVRELEAFFPVQERRVQLLANRGANGIDGVVSTALGALAGAGQGRSGALLIGDVSLLHDMGGLLAARREGLPLVTVVIHNDGGGIFSYLPVAQHSPRFEALFATPHGLDLEPLARLHQIPFHRAWGPDFAEVFGKALAARTPSLIEVRLERERSVRLHRLAWEAAARAVEE